MNIEQLKNMYPGSWLLDYCEKINLGEIIAGRELKTCLSYLIGDLESDQYQFDLVEPHKRIRFIEEKCKHSISPFAGKPFLLELWQKALIEAMYGFKKYDRETSKWIKRFTEIILLIGRKNGKSSLASALANAEFFCGPVGVNIVCASNDYEQSAIVFDEINNLREESPTLEKVTRKNIRGIYMGNPKQKKKKGKFSSQNKAKIRKLSARTGAKEGRNIDFGIIDEVFEMKDNSLVMPIRQSMSTKLEPCLLEITTEGFTEDGYLDKRLKEARLVLKGELDRQRWLIFLYTQDSEEEIWRDESSWVKSNPGLGTIKRKAFLRQLVEESKMNSATRAYTLAKDFNVRQGSAQAWLQRSEIINTATFDIADFAGGFYISGNDFAETTDLCSSVLLLKKPDDRQTYFYSRYWIPESKLKKTPESDKELQGVDDVDYRAWERAGILTIVPGNSVETSMIADWHFKLLEEYDLKPFRSGYDNRFAKDFANRYIELFGDKITVNIPQEFKVLNNPMRTLEADMRDKLVNYNNNPMDFWCFCNTGITLDKLGRIMPVKMHTTKRIDGTAAKIIAYATLEWHRAEFMSLVN